LTESRPTPIESSVDLSSWEVVHTTRRDRSGMDKDLLERDLAAAKAEIDRIDREVHELGRRRALVEDYAASCAKLLGALDEVAPGGAGGPPAFILPMAERADLPPSGLPSPDRPPNGRSALSWARHYWGEVVDEAVRIIEREGRPLTAAAIHALHSYRRELSPEQVYDALYKRARRRRFVESVDGRFWLIDKPRP
jgi:hypothetical protein